MSSALSRAVGMAALLAFTPGQWSAQPAPIAPAAPAAPVPVGSARAPTRDGAPTVLLLDDLDATRPFALRSLERLREVLIARVGRHALLYVESFNLQRPDAAPRYRRIVEALAGEQALEPPALIIASGDSSVAVARRIRARWRRDIPLICLFETCGRMSSDAVRAEIPGTVQVRLGDQNAATARSIRSLLPALSEVVLIGATAGDVHRAAASMRPVLGGDVPIEPLVAPTHEELAHRFARLSSDAAIVYLNVPRDSRGRVWESRRYLQELVAIAPRPVFGWASSYVGTGMVGGPLLDATEVGDHVGRLAADILSGADPARMQPVVVGSTRVVYDWVPLRRFGIPLDRLPRGAEVINRPVPVWESYPRTTSAVAAVTLFLLGSIGVLVHSRRRVREANAAQLATSRRLLQAQDEERLRIARDLHDDLCQDMTILALDVDRAGGSGDDAFGDRVRRLIDRTRGIAVGLHATHVGNVPFPDTLTAHVASLQGRTGLDIRVDATSWGAEPPPAVALALFRCVQEALQNVIRHADATQVVVTVASSGRGIRIEVTDDGIGFAPAPQGPAGLGLASMRERMALVGGAFTLRSTRFRGTTIRLTAPPGP